MSTQPLQNWCILILEVLESVCKQQRQQGQMMAHSPGIPKVY